MYNFLLCTLGIHVNIFFLSCRELVVYSIRLFAIFKTTLFTYWRDMVWQNTSCDKTRFKKYRAMMNHSTSIVSLVARQRVQRQRKWQLCRLLLLFTPQCREKFSCGGLSRSLTKYSLSNITQRIYCKIFRISWKLLLFTGNIL